MVKEKRANNSSNIEEVDSDDQGVNGQPICGIIMPIASTPGYPDRHWGMCTIFYARSHLRLISTQEWLALMMTLALSTKE